MDPTSEAVVLWFRRYGRDLLWRHSRDPWEILVCETMSQQTQLARVAQRWQQFLVRFPTVSSCAEASVGDVVPQWVGLGYNRRAVSLWRCAVVVTENYGGRFPEDLASLVALPGVGPYTARAILVFALERDGFGVLDTNVSRILARRAGRPLRAVEAQAYADAAVPQGCAWIWNQAMLDIGATLCKAASPDCEPCPLRPGCGWNEAGLASPDPARGSAGVTGGQSRFVGSDRQGRGRLVAALAKGPVARGALAHVMGWPEDPERANRVSAGVVADGLAVIDGDLFRLP